MGSTGDPGGPILHLLRTGPKDARQLLSLSGLSKRTLYHRLERLEEEGHVAVFPLRQKDRWTSLYSLPAHAVQAARISGFEPLREIPGPLQEAIGRAVEELRRRLMRNPDIEEIAVQIGENPEGDGFRRTVYRVAGGMGWRPPTSGEREQAGQKLQHLQAIASLLQRGITPPGASPEEIARAREYMAENPEQVPELKV